MLLCFSTACGPKAHLTPGFVKKQPLTLVLLPVKASAEFRSNRISFFRKALEIELGNAGYLVLSEKIVNKICSSSTCAERAALADEYSIDAFVLAELESSSQSNFGLGYYNQVTASLEFQDIAGKQLAVARHTESERGGLVFQSGQVIQGLIEQYRNYGDDRFNKLSIKLARELVSSFLGSGQRDGEIVRANQKVEISDVELKEVKPLTYKICLSGTARSIALLVVSRVKSNLREITRGKYCGIFPFESVSSAEPVFLELVSVFGNPTRKKLEFRNGQLKKS
jgi:hypothetical protein